MSERSDFWTLWAAKDMRIAASYLRAAQGGITQGDTFPAGFNAFHSAELSLKALIRLDETEPPHTHNLEDLLDVVMAGYPMLGHLRDDVTFLNEHATVFRYPGPPPEGEDAAYAALEQSAQQVVEAAQRVYNAIYPHIPERP